MITLARMDRHADLVNRMSKTVGADLGAAVWAGTLRAEALRDAVLRCAGCDHADDCSHWLEDRADASGPVAPPAYCRNRALLTALAGA